MVEQVALLRTDFGIVERLVYFERSCLHPLAVFPIKTLLSDLTDVYLRVEVSGESLVMIAGVAVHDVEILNLLEVVLCCVSCEDACHARVESATEDSCQSGILEALLVSPLP